MTSTSGMRTWCYTRPRPAGASRTACTFGSVRDAGGRARARPGRGRAWPLGVEVCGLVGRAALAGRAWRPFAPVEPPWASPPLGAWAPFPRWRPLLQTRGAAKSGAVLPHSFDLCRVHLPGFGAASSRFTLFHLPVSKPTSRPGRPPAAPWHWPSSARLPTGSVLVPLSARR